MVDKRVANKTSRAAEGYRPIPFDPKTSAAKKRNNSTTFRQAYDAMEQEFKILGALLVVRHG